MITQSEVSEFKSLYCDENRIIANLLKNRLSQFFIEPVLDVGSGLGDITAFAFPDKKVIQIDVLDYSDHFLPDSHSRIVKDFFYFTSDDPVRMGTIFFSHVLQFLDDDLDRLNEKVRKLSPSYIVTVTNCNDECMKDVLLWVNTNFSVANPEIDLPGFPEGYILDREEPFAGTVQCENYSVLADQVIYLMDALPSASERDRFEEYLRRKLSAPILNINQKIKVYKKYE